MTLCLYVYKPKSSKVVVVKPKMRNTFFDVGWWLLSGQIFTLVFQVKWNIICITLPNEIFRGMRHFSLNVLCVFYVHWFILHAMISECHFTYFLLPWFDARNSHFIMASVLNFNSSIQYNTIQHNSWYANLQSIFQRGAHHIFYELAAYQVAVPVGKGIV